MKQQHQDSEVTIGLDLGERRHRFCALDSRGEVVEERSLLNNRASLGRLTARYPVALAVMEAGTHSPWVSRYLKRLGWEVTDNSTHSFHARAREEQEMDF